MTAVQATRGIDHLEGQPLPSEAVMLACATPDATSAMFLRLCRYPTVGVTWLWARLITPHGNWYLNENYLPCHNAATVLQAMSAEYRTVDGQTMCLWRRGARAEPSSCGVSAAMTMHREEQSGSGLDPVAASIRADFTPIRGYAGLIADRTEIVGRAHTEVSTGDHSFAFDGFGQFHEQPQPAARFVTPFTYASLWGEKVSSVALFTESLSGGYVSRGSQATRANVFKISAPGARRSFSLVQQDAGRFEVVAHRVHQYFIPIYQRLWHGSFVTIEHDGERFAGMINDWREESLPYVTV